MTTMMEQRSALFFSWKTLRQQLCIYALSSQLLNKTSRIDYYCLSDARAFLNTIIINDPVEYWVELSCLLCEIYAPKREGEKKTLTEKVSSFFHTDTFLIWFIRNRRSNSLIWFVHWRRRRRRKRWVVKLERRWELTHELAHSSSSLYLIRFKKRIEEEEVLPLISSSDSHLYKILKS